MKQKKPHEAIEHTAYLLACSALSLKLFLTPTRRRVSMKRERARERETERERESYIYIYISIYRFPILAPDMYGGKVDTPPFH